jgi:hypothetical protein
MQENGRKPRWFRGQQMLDFTTPEVLRGKRAEVPLEVHWLPAGEVVLCLGYF